MIELSPDAIGELPVDERALLLLEDLRRSAAWSERDYLLVYQRPVTHYLAEAFSWLRGRAFIATDPGQQSSTAFFVTPRGTEALSGGLANTRATERFEVGLHPLIDRKARRQFLLGEYEQAVFVAMKEVEIRVRALSGLSDLWGATLMQEAFSAERGALADNGSLRGEQVGTMELFKGAYAVLRNPAGHRAVDYDDVTEASEAVAVASLLMRILDRVEDRLAVASGS
jgi:uncharacterized protein (TIGR02391 family)